MWQENSRQAQRGFAGVNESPSTRVAVGGKESARDSRDTFRLCAAPLSVPARFRDPDIQHCGSRRRLLNRRGRSHIAL